MAVVQPDVRAPLRCPWMCFTDSVPSKKILHCENISFGAHAIAQPCRPRVENLIIITGRMNCALSLAGRKIN